MKEFVFIVMNNEAQTFERWTFAHHDVISATKELLKNKYWLEIEDADICVVGNTLAHNVRFPIVVNSYDVQDIPQEWTMRTDVDTIAIFIK